MNMWIITCGKQHDLGRLNLSDGLRPLQKSASFDS